MGSAPSRPNIRRNSHRPGGQQKKGYWNPHGFMKRGKRLAFTVCKSVSNYPETRLAIFRAGTILLPGCKAFGRRRRKATSLRTSLLQFTEQAFDRNDPSK
jgi:hypothetical protein